MPEGPSIVILKDAVQPFKGKKIIKATGNTRIEMPELEGQRVVEFKSWGKHFLICFRQFTIRIHFMLFGTYRINEEKATASRLSLQFENGVLNFYACSVKLITEPLDEIYDWSADVLSPTWNQGKARKKLKAMPDLLVCDALLEQNIFAGVGNIIKNEVLFRIRVHPKCKVGKLPVKQCNLLLKEAVNYSYDFLEWKKAFELKKHWLAHTKKICPRCNIPLIMEYLGKTNRRSFFCNNCQVLYK